MPRLTVQALVLDPSLRAPAGHGWRGPLGAVSGTPLFDLASAVVAAGQSLAARTAHEDADMPDATWMADGAALSALLGTNSPNELSERVIALAARVKTVVAAQPTLVRAPAPAKVFGDIHGQLRDLLLLLRLYGYPSHTGGGDIETCAYVFNGDWVDRGAHQLEVVVLLFALKARSKCHDHHHHSRHRRSSQHLSPAEMAQVIYPERIFLVRGNHEFRSQSESMGEVGFARAVRRPALDRRERANATRAIVYAVWLTRSALRWRAGSPRRLVGVRTHTRRCTRRSSGSRSPRSSRGPRDACAALLRT